MPEKKKKFNPAKERTRVEPFEEEEMEEGAEEEEATAGEEEAIGEEELATSPELAEETAEAEEALAPKLTLRAEDLPQLETIEIGTPINAVVELTLRNKNEDGTYDLDVTDIYSQEEETALEEEAGSPAPPAGGGLQGAFG